VSIDSPILVYSRLRWAERLTVALLGPRAIAFHALAASMDERSIACFPVADHCQAQEDNVRLLAGLERDGLAALIQRLARGRSCDPERFLRLARQRFLFGFGHRLLRVRQALCVSALTDRPVRLATGLPLPLMDAFLRESDPRLSLHRAGSALLRLVEGVASMAHLAARHCHRIARFATLLRLPARPGGQVPAYIAWLGASPAEVGRAAPEQASLTSFLAEGVVHAGGGAIEVVIHGAAPAPAAGARFIHRPHHPAMRFRPSGSALVRLVAGQIAALARDAIHAGDWRHRELAGPILLELPALAAWFGGDPPAAVLYTNHSIGGESAAPLIAGRHGVRTMMVLYSTNYRYHVPPRRPAEPRTSLFPESRHVAADMVTMWSDEMAAFYRGAAYPPERVPVVGPVHFAHQGTVRPTSRYLSGRAPGAGPLRVGVFDVSSQRPARMFAIGYGQTMYFRGFAERFFADLADACRAVHGEEFVLMRKLKRVLGTEHAGDIEFDRMVGSGQRRELDPDANLWRVLEDVDMVVCMPFTSVALMADQMGIPAAFFDPLAISVRSDAAGRVPHLLGRAELETWLRAPRAPAPMLHGDCVAANVIRAALGTAGHAASPAHCAAA
jgi:hypothetical protein